MSDDVKHRQVTPCPRCGSTWPKMLTADGYVCSRCGEPEHEWDEGVTDGRDALLRLAYRFMSDARTALEDARATLIRAKEFELSGRVDMLSTALLDEMRRMRAECDMDEADERCQTSEI